MHCAIDGILGLERKHCLASGVVILIIYTMDNLTKCLVSETLDVGARGVWPADEPYISPST